MRGLMSPNVPMFERTMRTKSPEPDLGCSV
jgi:hypothetical protein